MDALTLVIVVSVIILGFVIGGFVAYTRTKSVKSLSAKPRPGIDYAPGVGDDDHCASGHVSKNHRDNYCPRIQS